MFEGSLGEVPPAGGAFDWMQGLLRVCVSQLGGKVAS